MRILLVSFMFAVALSAVLPQLVYGYQTTFFFHNNQELSLSLSQIQIGSMQISIQSYPSSSSARTYEEASISTPSGTGTTVTLTAQIYVPANAGQPSGYAAVVAWFMKPFQSRLRLDGDVNVHVWMSSNDDVGFLGGSLLFLGVADYSPSNSKAEVLSSYVSDPTIGNSINPSPKEYSAPNSRVHITQHDFQIGNRLVFFAGAGSTKQGWKFNVYFDGLSWNSRAEVPVDATLSVPEFTYSSVLLALSAVIPSVLHRKLGSNSIS